MDLVKDIDAAVFLERLACWAVFASILLLSASDPRGVIPNDASRIIAAIVFELISITVLLRIRDSSLVRDLIDLSIYMLLYKIIFLVCYEQYQAGFVWLYFYIHPVFLTWMGLLAFTRLLFFPRPADTLHLVDWPSIGIYGWRMPKNANYLAGNMIAKRNWFRIIAAAIILLEITFILMLVPFEWSFILTAAVGLEIVAFRIYPFDSAIRAAFVEKNASIAYYQGLVSQAADVISHLTGDDKKAD